MIAFGCLGHWYVQLLFAVPSVGMVGAIGRDSIRKRWAARRRSRTPSSSA